MLSLDQLLDKIAAYDAGRISLNEFEDWFRDESEDVHLWGDRELNEFVFALEALFSERHFESLAESRMREKMQKEARRFARPFASYSELVALALYEARAKLVAATPAPLRVLPIVSADMIETPPIGHHSVSA